MKRIKFRVTMDRMGNVLIRPVREDVCRKVEKHLESWDIHPDATGFIQECGRETLLHEWEMAPSQVRDVEMGWPVTILRDPEQYLNLIGWDANVSITV